MDKLRVGIVGSKFAATLHAEYYRRNNKVEIVAVAALDNLEEFATRFHIPQTYEDFHEMVGRDDIDAVSVCVPNFLHHEVTILPFGHRRQDDQSQVVKTGTRPRTQDQRYKF